MNYVEFVCIFDVHCMFQLDAFCRGGNGSGATGAHIPQYTVNTTTADMQRKTSVMPMDCGNVAKVSSIRYERRSQSGDELDLSKQICQFSI